MKKVTPEQQILQAAKDAFPMCHTWMDLHNRLYGVGGLAGQLFTTMEARTAFQKTPEAAEIQKLIHQLTENGTDTESVEAASGKILVRLPKSLHAALMSEAVNEGTSLNQLIVAKLSLQLNVAVKIPRA